MRCKTAILLLLSLTSSTTAASQLATIESLGPLRLDSVPGDITIYYSKQVQIDEARELQRLMQNCVAKYRGEVGSIAPMVVAVLDSSAWTRATGAPYGIPHHNPFSTPVVVVVPATAGALGSTGIPSSQAQRFFRLLALHEAGHLLTFAAIGFDRTSLSPGTTWPVPRWYMEFAADYFRISCLPTADMNAGAPAEWLASNRPLYPLLDEVEQLHQRRTADGKPYLSTPGYWTNFSWLMHVTGHAARLQQAQRGEGFVALLREQWQRTVPSSTQTVLEDLKNPGVSAWLRSVGAIR